MRVPQFNQPEVATQAAPTVRRDPSLPIEAFGGGAAAQGLVSAGQALQQFAAEQKQKADATALMEADNAAWEAEKTYFHNPDTGLFGKSGKEAVGYQSEALKAYEGEIAKIEGTLTKEQRLRFRGVIQNRRQSLDAQSLRYVAQEADRHNAEVLDLKLSSALDEAVANRTDPERIEQIVGTLAGAIEQSMPRASAEARALKLREAQSAVLATVIQGRLNDDFASAETFFQEHADKLTAEHRIAIEGKLRPVADMLEVEAGVDAIEQGLPPASAGISGDYSSKRRRLESAGDPNAFNPRSGAAGPDQFLASTWKGLVARHQPAWAKGLTEAEILKARFDPDKSAEMVAHFDRENAGVLRRGGAPVNDQTMYLAHHFGAEGALKIIGAPDATPMRSLVSKAAYDANPHLHGKTKAEVVASFQARGIGAVDSQPSIERTVPRTLSEKLALVDQTVRDPRDRAAYKAELRARDQERRYAEQERERMLQDDLFTRLENADPKLPLSKILTPEQIAWAQKEGRIAGLESRRTQRLQGTFVQDNPALAEALFRERALDPEKFANRVLPSYADQLSTGTLTELVNSQKQMRGKLGEIEDYASEDTQLTLAFDAAGIPKGTKGDAQRLALRKSYTEEVRAETQRTGKKPNAEQRQAILNSLTLTTVRVDREGRATQDPGPRAYAANPKEHRISVPDPIAHDLANDFFAEYGRKPTEMELRALYQYAVRSGGIQ